jgi:hypothetical protein
MNFAMNYYAGSLNECPLPLKCGFSSVSAKMGTPYVKKNSIGHAGFFCEFLY